MKAIVTVESFQEMSVRKLNRARKLDRQEPLSTERRISFESADLLLACMTPQRLRLWEAAREKPRSVTELASALHRDRKSVHRDIQVLHAAGMLTLQAQRNPGHGQVRLVQTTAQHIELRARL